MGCEARSFGVQYLSRATHKERRMVYVMARRVIERFSGPHAFLSNFYESPLYYDGRLWLTVEHAFQAKKTPFAEEKDMIQRCETPGRAKKLGRKVRLRDNWDEIKIGVMLHLLQLKFMDPAFAEMLLQTGKAQLIEGNTWGDRFWGVCGDEGENWLGRLLMVVRQQLEEGELRIQLRYGDLRL